MDEYISRAGIIAEYDRQHQGPPGGARKIMDTFPAADVRPVVLCRDCIHARRYTNKIKCGYWSEQTASEIVCDDDFCSYGERRKADVLQR